MASLRSADRQLLGDAGLGLDTLSYAEALAGSGAVPLSHFLFDTPSRFVSWWPWRSSPDRRPAPLLRETLDELRARWREVKPGDGAPRIAIELDRGEPNRMDPFSVARVLAQPELGADSVFIASMRLRNDPRWQWPIRIAAWGEDFRTLQLDTLRSAWPASSLSDVQELSRNRTRNEILVIRGSVRDALQRVLASTFPVRAAYVMLFGPTDLRWDDTRRPLETLLSELQAGGISFLSPKATPTYSGSLLTFVRELSHNTPFDVALHRAFAALDALHVLTFELIHAAALPTTMRELSTRFKALPPTAAPVVMDVTRRRIDLHWRPGVAVGELARELSDRAAAFPYDRESEGGTATAELSDDERSARRDASQNEVVRSLQADLFVIQEGELRQHSQPLRVGDHYRLDVFIAPGEEGTLRADRPFPDAKLDWGANDRFMLTVLFAEATQWNEVQRGVLVLPRYGASDRSQFVFTPTKAGRFRARLTVMYRGRVLQTSLLQTRVRARTSQEKDGPAPRLVVESRVRASLTTLDDRQRFDAAVVFNRSADGRPTMQAGGDEGAYVASLDRSAQALQLISSRMHEAAKEARRYSKGLKTPAAAELLVDLATHGNTLYRNLVLDYIDQSPAAQTLRKSDYLQIVATKPEAIVPLELVYDYPPPRDGAQVCPNAAKAVAKGECLATCQPKTSPAARVCPLGFWGLKKVIERHVHVSTLQSAARITGMEPIVGRSEVRLSGTTILATSKEVVAADQDKLTSTLKRRWKSGGTNVVKKWAKWPDAIKNNKPVLIVALPHSTGTGNDIGLEISGDTLKSRFIADTYVRAEPDRKPPLVILLGCDTAQAGDIKAYMSHVDYFRQATAPLILGTVTSVDAKDSATCARLLIEHLVSVIGRKPARFGTVLLQTKREAVASGLIMALGLAGFGDADWQLTT